MASSTSDVTRPPLKPAPTQQQESRDDDSRDAADEAKYLTRAERCWDQSLAHAGDSQGPKWAAESAKYERLACAKRDKINARTYQRELMEHERQMAGLGRRAAH